MMRMPVVMLATVVMASGLTASAAADEGHADGADLVVVKFHADWCGSCKAMGDTFEDLTAKLDSAPVLFVNLDQTTSAGRTQAGYLMDAMGADAVWDEHGGKTGFILLIDPDDMSVAGKLTKDMGFKDMVKAIDAARDAA